MVGGLVGCQTEAALLADKLRADLDEMREASSRFPARLRTFFEEWDDPLISGIRWVEELVEIAGGLLHLSRSSPARSSPKTASSIRLWW